MDMESPIGVQLSDVTAVAAHELRHDGHVATDLHAELMQRLRADGQPPEVIQLGHQLGRALDRLVDDVDRLLEGYGGELHILRREPTHLGDLILRVVHAHPTGDHTVDVDAAPVVINVDPVKVERIVDNLLANALVHTPDGCPVRLHAQVEPGGVQLVVEDDGPGLSPADADRFLTVSEHPPESGMGLWIVSRFAALHGGDAQFERLPAGGARFVVRLPA